MDVFHAICVKFHLAELIISGFHWKCVTQTRRLNVPLRLQFRFGSIDLESEPPDNKRNIHSKLRLCLRCFLLLWPKIFLCWLLAGDWYIATSVWRNCGFAPLNEACHDETNAAEADCLMNRAPYSGVWCLSMLCNNGWRQTTMGCCAAHQIQDEHLDAVEGCRFYALSVFTFYPPLAEHQARTHWHRLQSRDVLVLFRRIDLIWQPQGWKRRLIRLQASQCFGNEHACVLASDLQISSVVSSVHDRKGQN